MDKLKILLILGTVLIGSSLGASEAKKAIEKRIFQVGQVCIEGQDCAESLAVARLESTRDTIRSGEDVYNTACTTCHGIGLAGAPKLGDRFSWGERANKDLDLLIESVTNGLNGMPAMGLCMDCNQKELANSVQYMLDSIN